MALTTNLISFWELEEASGTRVDAHGDNDMAPSAGGVGQGTGVVGNCADFEVDSAQYLTIARNAALDTGDIDFTLACWMNLESQAVRTLLGKSGTGGTDFEYSITYTALNVIDFTVAASAGNTDVATASSGAVSPSAWHFVVAWHQNGVDISIQIDNGTIYNPASPHTLGVYANPSGGFGIGGYYDGSYANFDGLIDQVGFWKRLLTVDERTWLYNAGAGRSYAAILAESAGGSSPLINGLFVIPIVRAV